MNSVIFNPLGEKIQNLSDDYPKLKIVWAKSFNNVYCHTACLYFSFIPKEIFSNEYFKVSVGIRQQIIEKGEVKSYYDQIVYSHIVGKYENGIVSIPLNSVKILDSLCENGWTSLKNGERGATKSFPLSISVELDNKKYLDFVFQHHKGKFPFTICENEINKLKNNEKLETSILLI